MGHGTLIQRITYRISGRSLSSSGLYTPQDYLYDYALGGIPFLSATSDSRPDTEKPVPQRKQQFDNYKDPGEYSLQQWWLRSQSSFQGGAGVVYQDPDTQGTSLNLRYAKSIGIDPFTDPDIIQLLREVNESSVFTSPDAGGGVGVKAFDDGTLTSSGQVWIVEGNGKVTRATVGTSDISGAGSTTIPSPAMCTYLENYTTPGLPPGFDNSQNLLVYSDNVANGGVYKIDTGSLTATKIYSRFVSAFTLPVKTMSLSRGQLYINVGSQLFSLNPGAAAATPWPASPVASVPGSQTIISITDGPDAIYVAANDDRRGYIYKTTFDSSGIVNGLTQVAILPDGERINCIAAYVATYLVISTMSSIRVANFTGSGIVYGPPIVQVPISSNSQGTLPGIGISGSGFGKIQFYGTRAYITTQTQTSQHDGAQGIMAVDLSVLLTDNNTNSQSNAYCPWVYSPTTVNFITGMTVTKDGRIIYGSAPGSFIGASGHLWVEHLNKLITSGYLDTGRCRFNTIEPKLFKYFSIRTPTPLAGDVQVALLDDENGVTTYITYGPTVDPGTGDIATPAPPGPRNWEALRFTLKRGTDVTKGGKVDSWQIKALPGVLKQRLIVRQFLCLNSEKDKSGQQISGDTQALDKLTAIRQMCQRGDTVTLQDLVNNISDQVIIDDYTFTMLAAPGPNGENYGGYLTVTMRTVADAVPPISVSGSGVDES